MTVSNYDLDTKENLVSEYYLCTQNVECAHAMEVLLVNIAYGEQYTEIACYQPRAIHRECMSLDLSVIRDGFAPQLDCSQSTPTIITQLGVFYHTSSFLVPTGTNTLCFKRR